jgi:thioredoxin 1
MSNLFSKVVLAAGLLLVSSIAQAAQPFSADGFQAAQRSNKSILVDVTAPWCPTCKAQRPVIAALEKSNPQLVVMEIDFDTSKDLLRKFGVQTQSTLIVYKGDKEVGRSTGVTDATAVSNMVKKAL